MAVLWLTLSPAASAQELTAEAALGRLFQDAAIEDAWFAPSFLAQVPAAQVRQIVDGLERRHGALRSVGAEGDALVVRLDRLCCRSQVGFLL